MVHSKSFEMKLQDIVLTGDMPMKVISEKINKKYSTLMRELSPWDDYAKLGLSTAIAIMRVTRDRRILDLIIEASGMDRK